MELLDINRSHLTKTYFTINKSGLGLTISNITWKGIVCRIRIKKSQRKKLRMNDRGGRMIISYQTWMMMEDKKTKLPLLFRTVFREKPSGTVIRRKPAVLSSVCEQYVGFFFGLR